MSMQLETRTTASQEPADVISAPIQQENGSIVPRFFFDGPLGHFLRDRLDRDRQDASLSKAFRTFYKVRPLLPVFARQLLQRMRNGSSPVADDWFLPIDLLDFVQRHGIPDSVWPNREDFAFVLTHDVETQRGVELIPQLADLEQELGFRSSWNFVPQKYKIDAGLIRDLSDRGFEIGVHGYNHDGKLFTSRRTFDRRLTHINEAIHKFESSGFRSPMVHRNLDWMQGLDVQYDASCFDVDSFQAMPGGVQSFWPFLFGRFIELPYTLPQDHTLFITLGETTDRIWQQKLQHICKCRGMALMLTHPDYLDTPQRLAVYKRFLMHVKETGGFWHALPRDISDYSMRSLA